MSEVTASMMASVNLEIVTADALDSAARAEIIALCESAYGENFTRLFDELPGSAHVLARDERGALLSHAEWVTRWLQPAGRPVLRTAYVEAVATAPEYQGQGLASAALRRLSEALVADSRWELAALSPSDSAFYARLGWELWQGPLGIRRGDRVDPTPSDEEVMILRLPRTPATLDLTSLLTAEWRVGELW
jgi:aminoglycoside 2'-N-acetyltransferase I